MASLPASQRSFGNGSLSPGKQVIGLGEEVVVTGLPSALGSLDGEEGRARDASLSQRRVGVLPDRRVLACDGQSLLDQVIGDQHFDVVEHVEPVRKRGNGTDLLHPLALDRQCRWSLPCRSSMRD